MDGEDAAGLPRTPDAVALILRWPMRHAASIFDGLRIGADCCESSIESYRHCAFLSFSSYFKVRLEPFTPRCGV